MKLIYTPILLCFLALSAFGQLMNNSFENWSVDTTTSIIPPPFGGGQVIYEDPDHWDTPNQYTMDSVLGAISSVTMDTANKFVGNASARLETYLVAIPGFGSFNVPGVVTNGSITVDLADIAGGNIDFGNLISGGSPVSQNPAMVSGYYQYAPAGTDTGAVLVMLTKWDASNSESMIVGQGSLFIDSLVGSFSRFDIEIEYMTCDTADTLLVIGMSSATQNGSPGTVMHLDSIWSSGTFTGNVIPLAEDDAGHTKEDSTITIDVLANDDDCDNNLDSVAIESGPANGTATVNTNWTIDYTPNTGYHGTDVFTYAVWDDGSPSKMAEADVDITIDSVSTPDSTGIGYAITDFHAVTVYPNPAQEVVNFQVTGLKTQAVITVYDLLGRNVESVKTANGRAKVDLSQLRNGIYFYNIENEQGNLLNRGKFQKTE